MSVDAVRLASDTLLGAEIPQQGDLLRAVLRDRASTVAEIVDELRVREPSGWAVAGCGDSLFAGVAAEYWFAALAGTPLRALNALAFSRYLYRSIDERGVLFAISYSGNTARVVEAAVAAKSRGATVVAITANESSKLVALADHWLPNDATQERSNCRTLSFQAALALLHLTATSLAGEPAPPISIASGVEQIERDAPEAVFEIASALPEPLDLTVVGGGFAHPVAYYGAAKLYEAATIPAHAAELEQFIHCEIFPLTSASCVVLVAPSGPSYARAVEVADGLRQLRATTIGLSDDESFAERATYFIGLPDGHGESAVPYLACVPLQYLALALALRRGQDPDLVSNKLVNRPLIESPLAWASADYETS